MPGPGGRNRRPVQTNDEGDFRRAFEAHPVPTWLVERRTLRFLAVNDAALARYGWSRDEFLALDLLAIRPPAERDALRALLAAERPLAPALRRSWTHRDRSGREFEAEVQAREVHFDGQPALLVAVADPSERRALERARDEFGERASAATGRLHAVLENMAEGFVTLDAGGRCTYANRHAAVLLHAAAPGPDGAAGDALQGRLLADALPADARAAFVAACDAARLDGRARVVDGPRLVDRWLESRVLPWEGGLAVLFADVSERRRAEQALRDSEREWRTLAEQLPAVVYRAEAVPPYRLLYVSPRVADFGYTPAEWTAAQAQAAPYLHPEDREPVLAALHDALARGEREFSFDYRVRDRRGQWRHVHDAARVVPAHDGRPALLQGVMVETSALRQAERALHEAEALRRGLIDQLGDGVLLVGPDHRLLDVNPAALEMLGYARDALLGRRLHDLLAPHERHRVEGEMPALLAGELGLVERDHLRRDGSTFPCEVRARALPDGRYLKVVRDISTRRAAERALISYQLELSELTQRLLAQERTTTQRLAQTLHDRLGQTLAVARLELDALRRACGVPEAASLRLDTLLAQAMVEVREALAELRPPSLEDFGLVAALETELARLRPGAGTALRLVADLHDPRRWPAPVEYSAFMIAREAVANALRHAQAREVLVRVGGDALHLRLEVLDDGIGTEPALRQGRSGHLGLVGMRERALAIGARLVLGPGTRGGTRVLLHWERPA